MRKFTAKQPRPAAARVKLHIAEHYLSENLSDSNTYYEKGRGRAQSAALVEDGKQTPGPVELEESSPRAPATLLKLTGRVMNGDMILDDT